MTTTTAMAVGKLDVATDNRCSHTTPLVFESGCCVFH